MAEWPQLNQLAPRDFWFDPDVDVNAVPIPGVLLSDRIEYYIKRVGLINLEADSEEEFWKQIRANLRPASIDLQLGADYYLGDDFGRLADEKPFLVIPPNQIAFVSTLEKLRMPLYLVGRFDLRIQLIYSGLVLGTGSQIDPGFTGRLSCPLYNLSDRDIVLKYRGTFATADFTKATPFAQGDPKLRDYRSYAELKQVAVRAGEDGLPGLPNPDGGHYSSRIFQKDAWHMTLADYLQRAGGGRQSSLQGLERRIDEIRASQEKFENRFFALQLIGLIVFVALAGTFVTYSVKWNNTVDTLVRQLEKAQAGPSYLSPRPPAAPVKEAPPQPKKAPEQR